MDKNELELAIIRKGQELYNSDKINILKKDVIDVQKKVLADRYENFKKKHPDYLIKE